MLGYRVPAPDEAMLISGRKGATARRDSRRQHPVGPVNVIVPSVLLCAISVAIVAIPRSPG
jgi:hypothetical protein